MLITTIRSVTKKWAETESREAVRAIIKKDDKILMVFIKSRSTYIFPGGGIEDGESFEETCLREAKEESGAIVEIIDYFGYIDEYRDSRYYDMEYNLKSHYYICNLVELAEQELLGYEEKMGFEPRLVTVEEALEHNLAKKNSTEPYLQRNIELLTHLKENKI